MSGEGRWLANEQEEPSACLPGMPYAQLCVFTHTCTHTHTHTVSYSSLSSHPTQNRGACGLCESSTTPAPTRGITGHTFSVSSNCGLRLQFARWRCCCSLSLSLSP